MCVQWHSQHNMLVFTWIVLCTRCLRRERVYLQPGLMVVDIPILMSSWVNIVPKCLQWTGFGAHTPIYTQMNHMLFINTSPLWACGKFFGRQNTTVDKCSLAGHFQPEGPCQLFLVNSWQTPSVWNIFVIEYLSTVVFAHHRMKMNLLSFRDILWASAASQWTWPIGPLGVLVTYKPSSVNGNDTSTTVKIQMQTSVRGQMVGKYRNDHINGTCSVPLYLSREPAHAG